MFEISDFGSKGWYMYYLKAKVAISCIYIQKTGFLVMLLVLAMSRENHSFEFPTRSDTNRAAQSQKMARGCTFWI